MPNRSGVSALEGKEDDMNESVQCTRCGTTNRAAQYFCSKCGLNLHADGGSQRVECEESGMSMAATDKSELSPANLHGMIAALVAKYRDAYIVAGTIVVFGTAVKVIGLVLGVIAVVVSLGAADDLGWFAPVGGLVLGALVGTIFYILGVFISAQGQILRATLDTAVNTSPFLGNEQRIGILNG
jgi:ribosomal protein L37E